MEKKEYDISVVLGSKNRKNLLKSTIESIRDNNFNGNIEIIVIDGGSKDGSCDWLAQQKDIITIIQPNYKEIDKEGISVLVNSWGNFMNIAFKYSHAPWIVMISDDLILAKDALNKGYNFLNNELQKGKKIGGGAFYFREYPRNDYYRIGLLPKGYFNINHGFFYKKALEDVGYIEEKEFNFYCADGDLVMRLNEKGWVTIPLEDSFANHLVHKPIFKKTKYSKSTIRDIEAFKKKYPYPYDSKEIIKYSNAEINNIPFWKFGLINCIYGILMKLFDKYR